MIYMCVCGGGGDQAPRLKRPDVARAQTGWCKTPLFIFFRVRLVERGSPHSLPLMESGKVTETRVE